jgi:hypothetical protein
MTIRIPDGEKRIGYGTPLGKSWRVGSITITITNTRNEYEIIPPEGGTPELPAGCRRYYKCLFSVPRPGGELTPAA